MKKMFILLLALLIVANCQCKISMFIDDLKSNGYYDLIHQIKCAFGDDVAISICRELVQKGNQKDYSLYCEEVTRVYMNYCINTKTQISFEDFIHKEENMNILLKNLSPNEIEKIIKKNK